MGFDILPEIEGYKKYADQNILKLQHGGIVAYVHKALVPHVFDVTYNTCYISFRLDFAPLFIFIGVYIQPENSKYFTSDMFSDLSDLLISANEKNLNPVMGGDMNCRFGNLKESFSERGLWYDENVDTVDNFHGRTYGIDLCKTSNIFPLNHLSYKENAFEGGFTYYKGDKRSQLDFAFTNMEGVKHVVDFRVVTEDWHLSDHLPIIVDIRLPESIQSSFLLKRAKDLNYEFDPHKETITRYLASYDSAIFERKLRELFPSMDNYCRKKISDGNLDGALQHMRLNIANVYKVSKIKKVTNSCNIISIMNDANKKFENE